MEYTGWERKSQRYQETKVFGQLESGVPFRQGEIAVGEVWRKVKNMDFDMLSVRC